MSAPFNRPAGNAGPLHPNWQSISVRPWSLAKLKDSLNPMFPAGTIVALSNELRAEYNTPTKYEGQGSPNLNASTRVRVYKWYQDTRVIAHPSRDGGKPFSIQHKHLIDPITRTRKTDGGWGLTTLVKLNVPPADAAVPYMTAKYPKDDPRGVSFPIPNGTLGLVKKCMTSTNQDRTGGQQKSSRRTDWWYVVHVGVHQTQWLWLPCREYVSVLALERLTPQEERAMNEYIGRTTGPAQWNVVSITEVPGNQNAS